MNDEYAINDRIAQLISEYGLTNADFAKKIGVTASSISHILSKRNKPRLDFLLNLLDVYKDIDANWLLTGVRSSRSMARSLQDESLEPDLFTALETENKSAFVENNEKQQKTSVFSPPKDSHPKKIEKIVTFYNDKTFTEYFPE